MKLAYITNSRILWSGLSLIDGAPIALVATGLDGDSANSKTGGMIQTFIIRSDMHPIAAIMSGADESICGNCPARQLIQTIGKKGKKGKTKRPCYVEVAKSVASVYRALIGGRYLSCVTDSDIESVGAGRKIRMGTYGDPAAVPVWVWRALLRQAIGRTGYTHQWDHPDPLVQANAYALRPYVVASADTAPQALHAWDIGYRTFRVRREDEPVLPGESICPASAEAGKVTDCATCQACDGAVGKARAITSPSKVIIAHGSARDAWIAMQARLLAN
jgi:hypothetical protein